MYTHTHTLQTAVLPTVGAKLLTSIKYDFAFLYLQNMQNMMFWCDVLTVKACTCVMCDMFHPRLWCWPCSGQWLNHSSRKVNTCSTCCLPQQVVRSTQRLSAFLPLYAGGPWYSRIYAASPPFPLHRPD